MRGPAAALGSRPEPPADADPVRVRVALTLHEPVLHRVARVDLPAEQLGVVALELVGVLPYHLEVHYRLTHATPLDVVRVERILQLVAAACNAAASLVRLQVMTGSAIKLRGFVKRFGALT